MRLLLVIVLCFNPIFVTGQTLQSTTTVVEQSLTSAATELVAPFSKGEVVQITVEEHPDARWIESVILREAQGKGLDVRNTDADASLIVVPTNVSTIYELVPESDFVLRIVTVELSAIVSRGNTKHNIVSTPIRDSTTCFRQDAIAAESHQHRSTHGELPLPESSLWDDALEPVIFIGAAVATVVLLFTVRSQ